MGFQEFKKAQAQNEQQFIEETESVKSYKDERFWQFTKVNGNAKAIVRFLPQKDPTKTPYVKTFRHSFQNMETKRWFIEDCPWTIKTPCPVCSYAKETYDEFSKLPSIYRPTKNTWYIANVLIIKDEGNPENEGKVFLYRFGKEIFKRIESAIKGDPDDDVNPIKVFNMFDGHNFRFNVSEKVVPGFKNPVNDYEKCRFESVGGAICDGVETEMEKVYNAIYDLNEFYDASKFKSEVELKEKLKNFLGGSKISIIEELSNQKPITDNSKSPAKQELKSDDDTDDFFAKLDEDGDSLFDDED